MGVMDEIKNGSYKKRKKTIAESIADGTFESNLDELYDIEDMETYTVTDAIAPTKKTVKKDNWFQAGAFGDDEGNFLTDTLSAAGSTVLDVAKGVGKGVFRLGEGVGDAVSYGISGVAKATGSHELAEYWKKKAQDDVTEKLFEADNKYNEFVNKNSLIGEKGDNITEGLGYVAGMIATGGAGKAIGLGAKGVTALTSGLTFTSSTGSGMTEAYKGGATDEEAVKYGLISGVAEAGTELIFGGLGKTIKAAGLSHGLSQADDILAKKVSGIFQNQIMKNISEYGIKAGAEGLEEVASGIIQAVGQKMTYMEEKDIQDLLKDQNLLEQFITGAVVSGIAQAPSLVQSNSAKRDFITGYTQNEQKIYDNEVTNRSNEIKKQRAVETRVNELLESAEKTFGEVTDARKKAIRERVQSRLDNGELDFSTAELSAKELTKIEEEVKSDLEKGFIDIGTIESTFSNDKTTQIKELQQQLEATKDETKKQELTKQIKEIGLAKDTELRELLKNDVYLRESYRQEQLKGESFTYETKETDSDITKELVESAKNAGMNDTRKMHDLFDWVNKVSNDKGTKYGFVNNTQLEEMGYYDDLKAAGNEADKIGGLVRVEEDGTTKVLINVDSDKALNTIIGHETTHLLEGTNEYKLLQDAVKEYGTTKGDYDKKYNAVKKLYEGTNANIENEVTSDLVGDYLFTDEQFINSLSVKQPNVFTKIYDYIKHAVKMATAGSKEARQLEQLKYRFEQAYKQNVKTREATKTTTIDVSNIDDKGRELSKEQATYFKDSKVRDEKGNLLAVYHGTRGDFNVFETKRTGQNYEGDYSSLGRGSYFTSDIDVAKDFGESSVNEGDLNIKETYLDIKNPFYADDMAKNDSKILKEISEKYDIKEDDLYSGYNLVRLLRNKGVDSTEVLQGYGYDGIIADGEFVVFNSNQVKNVDNTKPTASKDTRYSLSSNTDNQGRTLTKEQQEYFKNSKVRDENGNLLTMYHGTEANVDVPKENWFTIFNLNRAGDNGSMLGEGFYFTTDREFAQENYAHSRGNVYETYLNITNPLELNHLSTGDLAYQIRMINPYIEADIYKRNGTIDPYKVRKYLMANGYDGIHAGSTYVAFEPEQIKNVDNTKPTMNPDIRYSLSGKDSEGRKLSKEQLERHKDISPELIDKNGNLKVVYHTTTDAIRQFNEFNPVGTPNYRFGNQVVNYYTDSEEMSGSYANGEYLSAETERYTSIEQVEERLKNINFLNGTNLKIKENNGKYEIYNENEIDLINRAKDFYDNLNENEQKVFDDFMSVSGSETFYIDEYGESEVFSNVYKKYKNWIKENQNLYENSDNYGIQNVKAPQSYFDYINNPEGLKPRFTYNSDEELFRNVIQDIMGENKYQYEGYLNMKKPYVIDAEGQNWNHVAGKDSETNEQEMQVINSLTEDEKKFLTYIAVETASGNFKTEGINNKDYANLFLNAIESGDGYVSAYMSGIRGVKSGEIKQLAEKLKTIWHEYSKDHIFKLAKYGFTDSAINTFENYAYTTNDIVHKVIEMNKNGANYDGVIIKNTTDYGGKVEEYKPANVYVTFKSNQFKSYDNTTPTDDPDHRYSLSNNEDIAPVGKYNVYGKDVKVQKAPKEKRTIKAPVKGEVKNDRVPKTNVEEKTTEGNVGTNSELNKQLQKEQNLFRKDFEKIVKSAIRDNGFTNKATKEIFDNIMSKENATTEDIYKAFDGHRQIKIKPDAKYVKEIKDIKGAIRSTPLKISDDVRQMVDFGAFRKSNYGSLKLRKDGIPIDTFYQELSNMYPEHFDAKITHQVDQLIEISNFVKSNTNDVLNQGEIVEITDADLKDVVDTISSALEGKKAFESTLQEMYAETIAPEPQKPIKNASKVESKQITPIVEKVAQNQNMGQVKQRKWTKTSTESDVVDGKVSIEDLKNVTYEVKSNKKTLEKANNKLAVNGYDESLKSFKAKLMDDSVKLEDLVLGERLIQEALNKGDTKTAADLIEDVAILGTELGQMVQALSIIQKLTPEGQLKMLTKVVKRGKTKDKAFANVELTQEMKDKILKTRKKDGSFDQNELTKAVEEVKQKLADQMETTLGDKTNAWRYLSMLGNPKTHIRNVVSNIAMMGTSGVKNIIARTIEDAKLGKAPVGSRTKTWKVASKDVTEYAKQVTTEVKDILTEENGYSENASIKSKRRTFETDILEKIYNFNSDMLTKEDWWFKKSAFNSSFAEFLTANGIKTKEDIANNPKLVEKGKLYAIEQARIATFSQMSYLANKINEIENKNIAGKIVIGSAMPFKKTPINIAKAGLSYSPLGFAKALVDIPKVKSGEMQASQLIDNVAQATTGSALALVGYMLAQAGFLNGGGEDDKEGKYDAQLGDMTYSIKIGDTSYSLSWLSPMAMPLFIGANFFETLVEKEEWNTDVVINTLAQTLDPLSEMSFLSGLTDVLSSYETGSMQQISAMIQTVAQNYLGQYIPTLSSQVASAIDDTKRVTTETNASGSKFINTTVNKLKYKIPGLRQTLEPSLDIWGNEIKQEGTVGEKIIDNFIAPYSKKKDITTPVDKELKSVYRETGENSVLPSKSSSYIDYKNEKYNMTNKEFTDFKKKYGQTSFEMLEELFQTNTYAESDSTEKAKLISKVYEYARDVSKKDYFDKHDVNYTNTTEDNIPIYKEKPIKNAIEYDMTPDEYSYYEDNPSKYHTIKAITDYETYKTISKDLYDIKGDKDSNDKTISGSRKLKVYDYINGLDLGYEQKLILAKMEYPSEDRYNYEIIDYLNNNNEIDYDTMESILLELGFKVDDYGNIRW